MMLSQNYNLKRLKILVIPFVCLVLLAPSGLLSEDLGCYFKIKHSMIQLPEGVVVAAIEDVVFSSTQIESLLTVYGADSLRVAFPDYDSSSSVRTARTGEQVILADMSDVYQFETTVSDMVSIAEALLVSGVINWVDFDHSIHPDVVPNDEVLYIYNEQWPAINGANPDLDMNLLSAWDLQKGGEETILAILDGGADFEHEDLDDKLLCCDEGLSEDEAWRSHGTCVSSIAAAETNNGYGVAGVDWNAKIYTRRIDNTTGEHKYNMISDAVDIGAIAQNYSWHFYEGPTGAIVRQAVVNAYKMNSVLVAAMGNECNGSSVVYPAAYPETIAVSAIDEFDGYFPGLCTGPHLDFVAPGIDVYCDLPFVGWGATSGTSVAAPHVTGLVGLLIAQEPNLYNDDIYNILRMSSHDLEDAGWDEYTGHGLVDARAALELLNPPFSLDHYNASGGFIAASSSGPEVMMFVGDEIGEEVVVLGKWHRIAKNVTFETQFDTPPEVWGRGVGTIGLAKENPNYGRGWCKPTGEVPITETGCQLSTYVYELWTMSGDYLGWYPVPPNNVHFNYTAFGNRTITAVSPEDTPPTELLSITGVGDLVVGRVQNATISVEMAETAEVDVDVYDILGRRVASIWSGECMPGPFTFEWSGRNYAGNLMSSGVYFVRLSSFSRYYQARVMIMK